ncbi:helix-turn-helix domain-containing protein, partial [Shouchella clausii]
MEPSCKMFVTTQTIKEGTMSCYHHLTTFDRARMETMTHLGMSLRQIAKNLGRSPSTISRERRRNANGKTSYQSEKAHEIAQRRRKASKPK